MSGFDLGKYWDLFPDALQERYGERFQAGFDRIEDRYQAVRSGDRSLTVDDVIAIFDPDLPFVLDWTKPDRKDLADRMESQRAARLIADLRGRSDDLPLLGKIIYCFRELSLTALVLQHVYPNRFAMCSHHLASQLYITAPTVPEFYLRYCKELREWSERTWPTPRKLNVVKAEFALWTWYRLACRGKGDKNRRQHKREFLRDHWVQKQRSKQIAGSLGSIDRLDLARAFLDTDPTAAAIIAWRELETEVRRVTDCQEEIGVPTLIDGLQLDGRAKDDLKGLWAGWRGFGRNPVMHRGTEVSDKREAELVLNGVVEFISRNTR